MRAFPSGWSSATTSEVWNRIRQAKSAAFSHLAGRRAADKGNKSKSSGRCNRASERRKLCGAFPSLSLPQFDEIRERLTYLRKKRAKWQNGGGDDGDEALTTLLVSFCSCDCTAAHAFFCLVFIDALLKNHNPRRRPRSPSEYYRRHLSGAARGARVNYYSPCAPGQMQPRW